MSTQTVSIQEAEKRLAELISLAEQGNEVFIVKDEQHQFKLVPVRRKPAKRVFGQHHGMARMREDFDEPLPDDFWLSGNPRNSSWIPIRLSGSIPRRIDFLLPPLLRARSE
ncbi:MAG: type II toxin-antitoxin system Phd/YefM family antitoxin [Gammaproteobacteria bacterium]